jgi:7-cyano-7-deazaguanine reductase
MTSLPNSAESSPLGKASAYADQYDASLLHPISRQTNRDLIGVRGDALPFMGMDLWTAYELSWLNFSGKPQVAIAHISVPCETPNISESKSLKLYFNSFNNTRFESAAHVRERIRLDVGACVWGSAGSPEQPSVVGVRLVLPEHWNADPEIRKQEPTCQITPLAGRSLDRLDLECTHYSPAPQLLSAAFDEPEVEEVLYSDLLKSNCLVTNQPDWGSVQISYTGPQINEAGLLRYIVSFRNHNEFHEQCVERIYTDIWQRCKPIKLSVYARYTRRGGLDINPWRTSHPGVMPGGARLVRQ